MPDLRKRLRIHGRVQGVCYRSWAVETARGLGLGGWVRNRSDGIVELLVAGDADAVKHMIDRCRQGPAAARVDRIDIEHSDEEIPASFEERPTA